MEKMETPNIEKLLVEKRKVIDGVIEKYLPRKIDKKYLKFLIGKEDGYNLSLMNKTIADPLWNFIDRGGKRFRPVLFLLILEALAGDIRKAKDFLIIPELLHAGTLIVDDLEDNSDLRRGQPCLHHLFGVDVAVNAGNLIYFLPLRVFTKKKNQFPAKVFQRAYQTYIQEMINLGVGQAIDIGWHKDLAQPGSEREYFEMVKQKTGSMLRFSVKMAAIFAGAPDSMVRKMGELAEKMGAAFQIQDDILDIELAGDKRRKFGKSFGNDIKEGKKTLMVIYTLRKADKKDKRKLLKILQKHTDDFNEAAEAIAILRKYNSIEYAKEKAKELIEEVQQEIDIILKGRKNRQEIKDLIDFLISRSY